MNADPEGKTAASQVSGLGDIKEPLSLRRSGLASVLFLPRTPFFRRIASVSAQAGRPAGQGDKGRQGCGKVFAASES